MDLPIDIIFRPVETGRISWGSLGKSLPFRPGPHPEAIAQSSQLIRSSKRPALVTGSGGHSAEVLPHTIYTLRDTTEMLTHSIARMLKL